MHHYDVIIIGSGGGAKLTQSLARLGKRVALIEKSRAGGTCLNKGCIPSKMLIYPSGARQTLERLRTLHVHAEMRSIDFPALMTSINQYTDGVSDKLAGGLSNQDAVDFYAGTARFADDHVVQVGDETLAADRIIIATGSRPMIPDWPGLHDTPFWTSEDALRNRALPKRLIVCGGGYIAAELGGAYAGFGSEVTFILRSHFLRREDPDIVAEFEPHFVSGKTIHTHTQVESVHYQDNEFAVSCRKQDGSVFDVCADALLVATGVVPNADDLGLEHTGIKVKPDGFIAVDDYLQTTVPGVYALGDVAGNYLFRHSVNFEAEYWVTANELSDTPFPIAYPPMPSAVFTHPEIASVGLSEPAARESGRNVIIGKAKYPSCAMALARGLDHGLVKLIADRASGELLGAHIAGEEASTLIQELVLALTHRLTVAQVYEQIYIHPAFPEVVRNALRDALKQLDPQRGVLF